MNRLTRLTPEAIEELAVKVRDFLLDHGLWQDVDIYFNGKRFTTRDPKTGKYHYNDRNYLFEEEEQNPEDYFKYVNPDHILSMSFEGPVCWMLYYGTNPKIKKQFDKMFTEWGLYYEFGDCWNFTCYYI